MHINKWPAIATALALAAIALGGGATTGAAEAAGATPGTGVNFLSQCRYSHSAPDDPIVAPGGFGASHMHDFFGNRSTNAASMYASLQAASTSCRRLPDTAAYWTPSLYQNGTQVKPLGVNAYYLPAGKDPATIQPHPAGLKIIAGNSKSMTPQEMRVASWGCQGIVNPSPSPAPPVCPTGLKLRIQFPDCWDGRNLDSADHKSHMAYSTRARGAVHRTCPATHPVPVAALTLNVRYPITTNTGLALSSGGIYSGHADFFNAWNQAELTRLTQQCLNAATHCGGRGP